MRKIQLVFTALAFLLLQLSCSEPAGDSVAEKEKAAGDTVSAPAPARKFDNDLSRFANNEGVIGVFDVGEMLCLSIIDSGAMKDVSYKVAKNYGVLEEELAAIGAQMDGPPGQISYNNDPENFKFECLLLIRDMPAKEPQRCSIVVLEASKMLVYNHYGPYQDLYRSYDRIRKHCEQKKLEQSGPVREFYLSDPLVEKDPAKWVTRILLPVIEKK